MSLHFHTSFIDHVYYRKRWQPGHRVCDMIQRQFAVPQTYSRAVNVLTNDAVFKGELKRKTLV